MPLGTLQRDGSSCQQLTGATSDSHVWERCAFILPLVLLPAWAAATEVTILASGKVQGLVTSHDQGSLPNYSRSLGLGWQAAHVTTAEVSAVGVSNEAHIMEHNQSYQAVSPPLGAARPSARSRSRNATKAVPFLLPMAVPSASTGMLSFPRTMFHGGINVDVLSHSIPPRHLAGPGAMLDAADGRPALLRRGVGKQRPGEDGHASDLSLLRMAADGVGTLTYDKAPTGSRRLNRELRNRLVAQDVATVVMVVLAFALTLLVSCLSIYHFSEDPSPVLFYSDPKFFQQRLLCSSDEADDFLEAFNLQPSTARLRIIGRSRDAPDLATLTREEGFGHLLRRHFARRLSGPRRSRGAAGRLDQPEDSLLFDVTLDLTPFITGEGRLSSEADVAALEHHLRSQNPLEVLVLSKRVEWAGWEDVATNIKQHLRSLGFLGDMEVRLEAREELLIYRNHPWQNFVRSRITQCLVVLSVVGALFWVPYLWIRMKTVRVESRFEIHVNLERYWELLAEGLHAQDGFQGGGLVH
mmetsp:Transcript_113791/g.332377  ORF Transcript_113791/g.332377 Transcript_113791/m.332377 type:complete len:525 (+) Transcript_113791:73-1647(+)